MLYWNLHIGDPRQIGMCIKPHALIYINPQTYHLAVLAPPTEFKAPTISTLWPYHIGRLQASTLPGNLCYLCWS